MLSCIPLFILQKGGKYKLNNSLNELEDITSIFALEDIEAISAEVLLYLNWSCISDIPDAQFDKMQQEVYNKIIRQVKKQAV